MQSCRSHYKIFFFFFFCSIHVMFYNSFFCSEHGRQLRLYDIRSREREIHTFGWKQSSESKSGLISQSWSHDGWHLSSGSLDPAIHLFDIRCNGKGPSQTIHAHQRRVFKAIWHQSIPLMTSVSSDHNIGLHEMEWPILWKLPLCFVVSGYFGCYSCCVLSGMYCQLVYVLFFSETRNVWWS